MSYNLAVNAEHLNITLGTPVTAILDGERCAPRGRANPFLNDQQYGPEKLRVLYKTDLRGV